jgi:hypothetical protein
MTTEERIDDLIQELSHINRVPKKGTWKSTLREDLARTPEEYPERRLACWFKWCRRQGEIDFQKIKPVRGIQ